MTTQWQYVGVMQLPTSLPTEIKDKWINQLSALQSAIYSRLQSKIPNADAFATRLADASSDQFENFLSAVGTLWDKDIITAKQRIKLAKAYNSWKTGIDNAFGVGGYFATRVSQKAPKLDLAKYTLGSVGYRANPNIPYGVWNPIAMSALLLLGDTRCARYFDANDTFTGTLEGVFKMPHGKLVRPSIIAQGVQACVLAKFADEGGLTTLRNTIITNANTTLDDLINMALDSTHKQTGYDVTMVLEWSAADSNVKVTVTDTHP